MKNTELGLMCNKILGIRIDLPAGHIVTDERQSLCYISSAMLVTDDMQEWYFRGETTDIP